MNPKKYISTVYKRERFGTRFYIVSLRLKEPSEINFQAGQYVSVEVSESLKRPYSIASSPSERNSIELCVDYSTRGAGALFFDSLKVGSIVKFLAPLGFFVIPKNVSKEAQFYFIAAGSGIAPIKSQILGLLETNPKSKIVLYFGTRVKEDILYRTLFENMSKFYKGFKYVVVLSEPDSYWAGFTGNVTDRFCDENVTKKDKQAFICGNPYMIKSAVGLLKEKRFSDSQIHVEQFSL